MNAVIFHCSEVLLSTVPSSPCTAKVTVSVALCNTHALCTKNKSYFFVESKQLLHCPFITVCRQNINNLLCWYILKAHNKAFLVLVFWGGNFCVSKHIGKLYLRQLNIKVERLKHN